MMPRLAVLACAALIASGAATRASGEPPTIYKWVDEQGVAHYTTDRSRIPSEIGTRIERAPSASPPVATHPEDEMRDAVPVKQKPVVAAPAPAPAAVPAPAPVSAPSDPPPAAAPAPIAAPAPAAAPAPIAGAAAPSPPPTPATPPVASAPVPNEPAPQPYEEPPPPLATDAHAEVDPVSAPPPAPVAPLAPQQSAELAKLDGQIETLEAQISDREEKLAALISTADDQRATPLVDDPKFREISQHLPKLQAELQTLRERRNKIQPSATP
jgi:hypothetical protein